MKIAVCITGHMRKGVSTYPNSIPIFRFIEDVKKYGLDIQYFSSTYNSNGHNVGLHTSDKLEAEIDILNSIENCIYEIDNDNIHDDFIDSLALKYKDVIKGLEPPNPPYHVQKYQILSMFNKINKCYNLVGDFDVIFRTRFDCIFNINAFLNALNNLTPGRIHIPHEYEFLGEHAPGGGRINDSMAIGLKDDMRIYMQTFEWLKTDECLDYMLSNNLWFCPHTILKHQLTRNNISYVRDNFQCRIVRKNGSVL
jgi:hypothetical protein